MPHLNESLPADFSVYEGDEPLLLGSECAPEWLIWAPYVTLTPDGPPSAYSAIRSPSQRSASFGLIATVTSRDGRRGLTVVTLSSLRPRLAQFPVSARTGRCPMTATTTALVPIQLAFSDAERLALAGFLAGYRGLTREAYSLDLRQFTYIVAAYIAGAAR
jgi:hypothetical protein